jgi:hypothetical protein
VITWVKTKTHLTTEFHARPSTDFVWLRLVYFGCTWHATQTV